VRGRGPPNPARTGCYNSGSLFPACARPRPCAEGKILGASSSNEPGSAWRDQNKRQQARDLLAPVHAWFAEGFHTLDLKEAQALLDALAS
jgi:hypothetical protein